GFVTCGRPAFPAGFAVARAPGRKQDGFADAHGFLVRQAFAVCPAAVIRVLVAVDYRKSIKSFSFFGFATCPVHKGNVTSPSQSQSCPGALLDECTSCAIYAGQD